MIIYHDENHQVTHVVTFHDPSYDPASNGELYVEHPEIIPHHRLHLHVETDESGEKTVTPMKKIDFDITLLTEQIKLGTTATFLGIPEGVVILANGEQLGVMDDSGTLDLEPETTGFFKVMFKKPGYMDMEQVVEVVG